MPIAIFQKPKVTFKCLVFTDQQSQPQIYSIYYQIRLRKVVNPYK